MLTGTNWLPSSVATTSLIGGFQGVADVIYMFVASITVQYHYGK